MPTDFQSVLLLITGVIAGLTSFPLVYLALRSHSQLDELRRSHQQLHRIVINDRRDAGAGPVRKPSATPRPHRDRARSVTSAKG